VHHVGLPPVSSYGPSRATAPGRRSPARRGYAIGVTAAALTAFLALGASGSGEGLAAGAVLVSPMPAPPRPAPALGAQASPAVASAAPYFVDAFDLTHFHRGNLHTHSNRSDGDSDPRAVYSWYREHGYEFVIVSDHNRFTDPAEFRQVERPGFIIIGGEEVTMRGAGRQVHVNALCTKQRLPGGRFDSPGEALAHAVSGTRGIGGIALVNHPNFTWGLGPSDLSSAKGARLLEIESGHPFVHTQGNSTHPSHEAMWDVSLTQGLDFMGVAVDDAHHLTPRGSRNSMPGRAWVEVVADTLDEHSICESLANGALYASTGVKLKRIKVEGRSYSVWPAEVGTEVSFIGVGGRELARRPDLGSGAPVTYELDGTEGYVRARIKNADGKFAWTPPVRVHARDPQPVARSPLERPAPPG
jgi:hypothetical protein